MIKKKPMNRANNSKFLIFIFDLKNAYQLIKNKVISINHEYYLLIIK